jgi:hypothetical protein
MSLRPHSWFIVTDENGSPRHIQCVFCGVTAPLNEPLDTHCLKAPVFRTKENPNQKRKKRYVTKKRHARPRDDKAQPNMRRNDV